VAEPGLSFAGLLRQLRKGARLTQEELAEAASVSPRSVSDLERGINRTARKDTALLLAGALSLAGPARDLFVAAARGRVPATEVLTAVRGEAQGASAVTADTAAGGMHGFPSALTSFIGRAEAMRKLAALLDQYRLVTVTGPGGAGKTRLAGEVAKRVAGRFADGVWLVELETVRDPAYVAAAVAAALEVREQPGVPTAEVLARVLARRQLLMVLDNCEHVIDAAAGLCAGLLAAADDVRVLATSREPLRAAGEARYRLASLALPDPDNPDDAAGVAGCDAVALFADRARCVDGGFALDAETGPVVARLVARLDGMPLAIELAAARVEALGVAQLLDLLDDRFGLLVAGDRLAEDRQRSLAATVQWSYQLLDERKRRVFRAVSVFPGPFTLQAAQAVAGDDAGSAVLHLVDCSLLSPPRTGPDGRSRYVMLETLRAYGGGLLAEAGEQDRVTAAMARYALQVAGQAAAGLQVGTEEVAAARWLDAEDATMRQVLAWATDHDAAVALRLANALALWWRLRGRLAGEYKFLGEVARRAAVGSDGWCFAQFWLGWTAAYSADLAGALGHFTAVRDAIEDGPPSRALAFCLASRLAILAHLGRIPEAVDDGRRALALARELGIPGAEVMALVNLGIAAWYAGDRDGAIRLARQAGQIEADIPGALARSCSNTLTIMLIEADDLAAAERICVPALARSRDADDLRNQATLLANMAILDLRAGRTDDAAAHLREELQIGTQTGDRIHQLNGLDCCGYLCAATRRWAEALTLWAALTALLPHEGFRDVFPRDARRRHQAAREAWQMLGPAQAQTAEARGAAMSLATAAEYALMLTTPGPPVAAPTPGKLSARELELVTLVAQGCTNAQIATHLSISVGTVSSHLDRIRDRTGCWRRADLTRLALSTGLV
jgi:predicted ATPase/DNA-binding CsgD family transcriptional regulator